jgi:flagellar protein FlaJ
MVHPFFHRLAKHFPDLSLKLQQANKRESPAVFVRKSFIGALYMSLALSIAFFLMLAGFGKSPIPVIFLTPIAFGFLFLYFLKIPDVAIIKKAKEIDKEIVFAGKFLIVELNSGVPLYQVLKNIAENYGGIGTYFEKIVRDIDLGTQTEEAINKAILLSPSDNFRKVMWQLQNSMRTGADISYSLNSVLEQIIRQQQVEVERYGKKLNPIAMFYLMMAVILPSLGMVMGVVFASFVDIQLNLIALGAIAVVLGFFQSTFSALIKADRPAGEM